MSRARHVHHRGLGDSDTRCDEPRVGDGAPVRALADDGVGCVSEADQISAAVRLVLLDEVAVLAEVAVTSDLLEDRDVLEALPHVVAHGLGRHGLAERDGEVELERRHRVVAALARPSLRVVPVRLDPRT